MNMAGEVKSRVGELTEQRDLLSVIFGGLVEGVVVVGPDGSIIVTNAAAKPLIGDTLPDPLKSLVERARLGEQPERELELVGRTVRVSARPLRTTNPLIIVVLYDVTRMRALENVRREFLSNAAHELRTPVTSIAGYAETLLGSDVQPELQKEFITTIHRNARRIADMVTDLVTLDQLGGRAAIVGERGAIKLSEVIEDAVRTVKGVKPSANIDVSVDPEVAVLATREGLDHVIQNLIDNAVKYGGGTGVKVRTASEDKRVRLTIEDAGPGIPEGHEERIFERFYRVDAGRSRDQGGTGLGLAIVKSHVEAMGGRVWFEHANPGARFVIELDAA
jgi:two-component system, OmpR family, phosphate regulon sensor histidine kinase PhoR